MESIPELREKVQRPVRRYNDVAGLLIGDRLSIHVTRLFVVLGLPATLASIAMLVCGLAGSALLPFGHGWTTAGFALLFLYYLFDCVDGEVARYRHGELLEWGFHDFMFHLYVKSAAFVGLGVWAVRATGKPWVFGFALAGLLATLFVKFLHDVEVVLACRRILMRPPEERRRFVHEVLEGTPDPLAPEPAQAASGDPYRPKRILPFLRVVAPNFDLALVAFLLASLADLFLGDVVVGDWRLSCKLVLYGFYGIALPIDFADQLQSHLRRDGFRVGARSVLRRAHHFRIDE